MKTLFRFVRWLLLAAFLLASALVLHTIYGKPLQIGWFYERVFIEYAADDPELLSSLGILPRWLVGMNKILALREKAKAALGPKFKLRDFHDLVLTGGDLPLALLERRVDAWIGRQAAK